MAVTLRFSKLAKPKTSPITLTFGDDGIALSFDQPWLAKTSPITLRFDGSDDTGEPEPERVPQVLGIAVGLGWQAIAAIEQHIALNHHASKAEQRIVTAWQGDKVEVHNRMAWASHPLGTRVAMPWQVRLRHTRQISLRWSLPLIRESRTAIAWRLGTPHQTRTKIGYHCYPAVYLRTRANWLTGPQCQGITHLAWQGDSVKTATNVQWGYPRPRWVCSDRWLDFAPKGKVTLLFDKPLVPKAAPITLQFDQVPMVCHWDNGGGPINANPTLPNLDFKIPIEPQIRRYYLMQPTLTCMRVSDNLPIVVSNVSISQSRGQWARSLSLEFSSRIDAERAHNELLLITINGYEFYAIAEQPSVSKVFGSATYNSTGRSRVAELAAPYKLPISYTNASARSFAGLLGDLLQNTGWIVELNGITDFTIPAGAFSVGNKTPIEAVAEAVGQLGCMILTDDAAKKLTIVPRWPTAPWAMATAVPDLALHDAVITSYSDSVSRNPLCNVVWLRGEQHGISAKVKRAGSAGNIPAADISAQLIVDNQAARVAGTNALAETGDKLSVNLSMPVMADLPPAIPGMLVGVTINSEVFKGVCDSWTIRATVSDRGDIDIEQSITLISPLES
ncbi:MULTISPECIES: hypothetical protein [Shewanella]|uniref:hypothetical protein n=1 Tax=Shewanella TaxID=22 RepID=UPI00201AEB93|nr:hypothetical protein [Shewanella sp. 10B]